MSYLFPVLRDAFIELLPKRSVAGLDSTPDYGFGPRMDGTNKGMGFASFVLPDGTFGSERANGDADFLYPVVYPGVSPYELAAIIDDASGNTRPVMRQIDERAFQSALSRASRGLSPFWQPGEPTDSLLVPQFTKTQLYRDLFPY